MKKLNHMQWKWQCVTHSGLYLHAHVTSSTDNFLFIERERRRKNRKSHMILNVIYTRSLHVFVWCTALFLYRWHITQFVCIKISIEIAWYSVLSPIGCKHTHIYINTYACMNGWYVELLMPVVFFYLLFYHGMNTGNVRTVP